MYKHDPSTNIEIGHGDSSWNVFHLRKNKMVINLTVMKMDNWMTILKQMKMEALILEAQKLHI